MMCICTSMSKVIVSRKQALNVQTVPLNYPTSKNTDVSVVNQSHSLFASG